MASLNPFFFFVTQTETHVFCLLHALIVPRDHRLMTPSEAPCGTSCGSARVPQKRPPEGPNSFRYRKRIEKDGNRGIQMVLKYHLKPKKKTWLLHPKKVTGRDQARSKWMSWDHKNWDPRISTHS